jgi:microcin C transport system permease protein
MTSASPIPESAPMLAYLIRRILLFIPTLFGIMVLNFFIVQAAPGGPIEQIVAQLHGTDVAATARFGGSTQGEVMNPGAQMMKGTDSASSRYPGAAGVDPELIKELEHQFGFDQPLWKRFCLMIWNYVRFDFGTSYFRDESVLHLVISKMPVSISLGIWMTLISYLISIPLGIRKAIKDGSRFDAWTSGVIVAGTAIPSFLFGVLLIVLFSGGHYFEWFPLRGLVSDSWHDMDWPHRILDYFWHITLPVIAMTIGSFSSLTLLTKNSFLDEISKQYVLTARSKGLTEHRVLYGHVFRNAMLLVIASFPSIFVSVFFTGSVLIENIFSLDGMGLLGFESVVNRDYPVVFATAYFFSLIGIIVSLLGDFTYTLVDPRIDFEARN